MKTRTGNVPVRALTAVQSCLAGIVARNTDHERTVGDKGVDRHQSASDGGCVGPYERNANFSIDHFRQSVYVIQ